MFFLSLVVLVLFTERKQSQDEFDKIDWTNIFLFFESVFEIDEDGRRAIFAVELQDDHRFEVHRFTEIKSIFIEIAENVFGEFSHSRLKGFDSFRIVLLNVLLQPERKKEKTNVSVNEVLLCSRDASLLRVSLQPVFETLLIELRFAQSMC